MHSDPLPAPDEVVEGADIRDRLRHALMELGERDRQLLVLHIGGYSHREIASAREIAGPDGFIAVNVMRALKHYAGLVTQACRSGADAIVMGAGLPFDLPELVKGFDDVALIPILSEPRGVRVVIKRWTDWNHIRQRGANVPKGKNIFLSPKVTDAQLSLK